MRNACVLGENDHNFIVANIMNFHDDRYSVEICQLRKHPFAMVECKRVGVEEGARKGLTTIEKAKQGAYVAKHVASLQKIRTYNGDL